MNAQGSVFDGLAQPTARVRTRTLPEIDKEFEQIGCLGHGGFGSVFLAKKPSGRRVALKFMTLDPDDNSRFELFSRELNAVQRLNQSSDTQNKNRDLAIVFFEEWFTGPGYACIVMNYVDGGTLAEEISSRAGSNNANNFYTERRIAWYALQLSEALAYAHERGVAHHDVKSANVLIDQSRGGRLLLADFGSAVAPGEDSVVITESYAPPELLRAREQDNYSGLEPDKVDAFGLGCILYELVCCQMLIELSGEQTLAEFIQRDIGGLDAALSLPCVRLPWLPADSNHASRETLGYSDALWSLIKTLLNPEQRSRWTPSQVQKPLRNDPLSPLLTKYVAGAKSPVPGAPVSVDNVQLGMFVQRGQDWSDGDADGGPGSIGVVVKVDADAVYTEVAWPSRRPLALPKPQCCRIGAGNMFELKIGPSSLPDFFSGTKEPRTTGLVEANDTNKFYVGLQINDNCQVVGMQTDQNLILVAPMRRTGIPTIQVAPMPPRPVALVSPRKPQAPPDHWEKAAGTLVELTDLREKSEVLDLFHGVEGMDIQAFEVTSIKRVQSVELWNAYALAKEDVAAENWGVANEARMFLGTRTAAPELLLNFPGVFFEQLASFNIVNVAQRGEIHFPRSVKHASLNCFQTANGEQQIVLSRVAQGRILHHNSAAPHTLNYHSETQPYYSEEQLTIRNMFQAFPEYVVTYKPVNAIPRRRVITARRPRTPGARRLTPGGPRRTGPWSAPPAQRVAVSNPFRNQSSPRTDESPSGLATRWTSPPSTKNKTKDAKKRGEPVQAKTAKTSPIERTEGSPATKMCVVCLERAVSTVLLPCGHLSLCLVCSSQQGLSRLKRKCPECRQAIREAATIYGRVVND